MANLNPINPLLYIKPHDPIPEKAMDSSAWFVTERVTINFGESVGRPEPNAVMKVNMIGYLLQQGWYIEAVQTAGSGGEWKSLTKTESTRLGRDTVSATERSNEDEARNDSKSQSSSTTGVENVTSTSQSSATSGSQATATERGSSEADGHASNRATNPVINSRGEITYTGSEGDTDSDGSFESTGTSTSQGTAQSQGAGKDLKTSARQGEESSRSTETRRTDGVRETSRLTNASTEEGVAREETLSYWSAAVAVAFVRRKISTKRLLGDMIKSFTDAYNEGRRVNDERYDEIVALYALMLGRTEDEANAFLAFSPDFFKPLADEVMGAIKDAVKKYQESASDIPNLKNRIDEINRKFDALLSQKRSEAISIATYNTTVWTTTESGIERDRQLALNDAEQEIGLVKIKVAGDVATIVSSTGDKILDCGIRIIEAQRKFLLEPTNLRNQVFKWMLDFMERRKDEYPALDKVAGVAATLGVGTDNGTTTAGDN